MNLSLYKATVKSNWLLGVTIFAVMMIYLSTIISIFDPKGNEALKSMLAILPKELVSAMGMEDIGLNFTGFIASYYYGMIAILFPLIYCIIAANRLIAKHVDRGSMSYLLSTPNTRVRIVITQAAFLVSSLAALFVLITGAGIGISEAMFKGELDIGRFIVLNLCAMMLFFAISGIGFFFSCIFNDTKYSLAFGAGIPIVFYVVDMLSRVSSDLDWLGKISIFTLFKPSKIIAGDSFTLTACILLVLIAVLFYGAGMIAFKKRDLPL